MIRLVSYNVYVLLLGYLLARWYGVKAYEGFYMPMFFIVVVYIGGFLVGEVIRPRNWIKKRFLIIAGSTVLVICFLGGHHFGYQKTVRLVSDWQRTDSTSTVDYTNLSDVEIFNAYTQELVGNAEIKGLGAYVNYHTYLGFIEYPKIQPEPLTGFWVYFSWLFQIIMMLFGLYVLYRSIDPEYDVKLEQQKEQRNKAEIKKKTIHESAESEPVTENITDPLLNTLLNYLKEAKTDWKNAEGNVVKKERILKASTFEELEELGFNATCKDKEGRTILFCLMEDRRSVDILLKYLDDEEKRLGERFIDAYGHLLLSFADTYGPIRTWGIHSYFDERFPPKYSTRALRKLEVRAVHLIKLGADINQQNERKITAFMLFSRAMCSIAFYTWLFEQGADVHAVDKYGKTPLFYAVERSTEEFGHIELLIKAGADVLIRDNQKKTVFNSVATMGKEYLFWLLFKEIPDDKKAGILNECVQDVTRSTDAAFLRNLTNKEKALQGKKGYKNSDLGNTLWTRDIKNALWVRDNGYLESIIEEGGIYHLSRAEECINTAVAYNYPSGLNMLIHHGASLKNFPKGYTPFMVLAFKRPHNFPEEILKILEPFAIPVDSVDDFDCTALDYLSGVNNYTQIKETEGIIEFGRFLLERGVNPNRTSLADNKNPIQRAGKII